MVAYRHNGYKFCNIVTDYVTTECIINNKVTLETDPLPSQLPRKTSSEIQDTFMTM
jgi:hypothetical protein